MMRFGLAVMFAIAILTAVLHVLGATMLPSFWGVHIYRFFHPAVLAVATAVLIGACTLVVLKRAPLAGRAAAIPPVRLGVAAPLSAVAGALLFWLARTRHTYLGDGNVLISNIPEGEKFHPREPLTMFLQQHVYKIASPLFAGGDRRSDWVARDALALGSVAAGVLFVLVTGLLAKEIASLRRGDDEEPPSLFVIIWLLLLTQGYMLLFFGYVENYSFYTVSIALYFWLSLRFVRSSSPLLLPGLALLLAMSLHLTAIILVPSFLFIAGWALVRPQRRLSTARDLVVTAAGFLAMAWILGSVEPGYDLMATLGELTGVALTRKGETAPMFSALHVRDFFNEQLLIGPLGMFLFVPVAIAIGSRRGLGGVSSLFLLLAGFSYLGSSWFAGDSNLGYARDWDVWAPGGLVFTSAGLGLFIALSRERQHVLVPLVCVLFVSLYHTVPWIALNASTDRGLARLKELPLGLGRTEVLVGTWYARNGDDDEARRWYERAIVANPANNNAYYLLAMFHIEHDEMDEAAAALEKAARLRPAKALFRQWLIHAYLKRGRYAESIPHLTWALERDPTNAQYWVLYADALNAVGRRDDALYAFERAAPLYEAQARENPGDFLAQYSCGHSLYNLQRYEKALPYFERALELQPQSAPAAAYVGYALRALGRNDEAKAYFERCLTLNPNHPDRDKMRAWIDEGGHR